MTLPIACAQLACTLFEPRQNLEKADHYIREATRQGARLIVLPEFLTSGCTYDHRMCEYAEEIGGPTTKWMVRHSTERRCWIAAGMLEKAGPCVYDTLLMTGPVGEILSYRKQYPAFFEMLFFHRGRSMGIFDTSLGRIGVMICWDMVHAHITRSMAGKIDLLLICSAWPDVRHGNIPLFGVRGWLGRQPSERPPMLADKLKIPVAYCNMTGPFVTRVPVLGLTYRTQYAGCSSIIERQGKRIAAACDEEMLLMAEIAGFGEHRQLREAA
jgi:predicted amidohydrolase